MRNDRQWSGLPIFVLLISILIRLIEIIQNPAPSYDAICGIGPSLSLFHSGRLYDNIVFDVFRKFMGWPPGLMVEEAGWYKLFGATTTSWAAWVFTTFCLLAIALYFLLRRHTFSNTRLAVILFVVLSGPYLMFGRPDVSAEIFCVITLLLYDKFSRKPDFVSSILIGLSIGITFMFHPMPAAIAALAITLYILTSSVRYFKYLVVAGISTLVFIGAVYVPYVLTDIQSWHDHFFTLMKSEKHFVASSVIKYISSNLPLIILILLVGLFEWKRLRGKETAKYFFAPFILAIIPFTEYYPYYFGFLMPFWAYGLIRTWQSPMPAKKPALYLTYLVLVGIIFLAAFKGSTYAIISNSYAKEYFHTLNAEREEVKKIIAPYQKANTTIFVDEKLFPVVFDYPNTKLFWKHWSEMHPGKDISPGTIIALTGTEDWKYNQSSIGSWKDSSKYEILKFTEPAVVAKSPSGSPYPKVGLIILRKK